MKTTGLSSAGTSALAPAVLEGGRDPQTRDADELVDGAGAPRAGEDDDRLVVPPTASRMIRRASSRRRVVCRPVPEDSCAHGGEDLLADEVLDEGESPARCRVVGIGTARAVGPGQHLVLPDDRLADRFEQVRCRDVILTAHSNSIPPRYGICPPHNLRLTFVRCVAVSLGNLPARLHVGSGRDLDRLSIVERTLPNGLRVIVSEDHAVPNVAVNLWVGVGSATSPRPDGLAHLFEHLMFRAAATSPRVSISARS